MRSSRTTAIALSGALSFTLLAACSSGSDDAGDGESAGGKTVLRVVSLLPGSEQEAFDAFDEQVAQFEAANPDIDIQPEEYEWKATTFAAQLAGGTLPDVFEIPFTDGKTLIENGQLADIDAQFRELPYAGDFNPNVLDAGTGADGKVYAIPAKSVYGIGLHYNRALFEQAGLDPDDPPTTWDEVRSDAKAIADATGQAGGVALGAQLAAHRRDVRPRRPRRDDGRRRHLHGDARQRRHEGGPGVPARPALGGQLHGRELPARLVVHQPGVRGRADRHVHLGLGRLHLPGADQRDQPRRLRPDRRAARG